MITILSFFIVFFSIKIETIRIHFQNNCVPRCSLDVLTHRRCYIVRAFVPSRLKTMIPSCAIHPNVRFHDLFTTSNPFNKFLWKIAQSVQVDHRTKRSLILIAVISQPCLVIFYECDVFALSPDDRPN